MQRSISTYRILRRLILLIVLSILTSAILDYTPQFARAEVRGGLSTVAITGEAAPGVPGQHLTNLTYSGPTIGPNGYVSFPALLSSGNMSLLAGYSPATLSLVALQFASAPGTSATFGSATASNPINAGNEIAAYGWLTGSTVNSDNDEGIWVGHPFVDTLVAREGSPAPIAGGYNYGTISTVPSTYANYTPVLNDLGQVGFETALQTSTGTLSTKVDWITQGPLVFALAQSGLPAPGLPGENYSALQSPGINDQGMAVFSGTFKSAGGPTQSGSGVWLATPGFTAPLAFSGMPVFSIGPNVVFQNVSFRETQDGSNAHLNSAGNTIFFGTLAGPGITTGLNDQGVWVGGLGLTAPVARTGDSAPGLAIGTTFSSFTDSGIGGGVSSAILATVSGPGITATNNTGIWEGLPGSLHLVVRNGDVVPDGSNAPLTISGLGHFTMNAQGEILAQLGNGSLLGANALGSLIVIARPGDSIQVAPGDFRTIESIVTVAGGEAGGGATALNDSGLVTFTATFTDGSMGTFVSSALAVPEPASIALAGLGILLLIGARRRWTNSR